MPSTRRKFPTPRRFANQKVERMWPVKEEVLDAIPAHGFLTWGFLHYSWNNLSDDYQQAGESPDEAQQLAWGTMAMAAVEWSMDLSVAFRNNELPEPAVRAEQMVLASWQDMSRSRLDDSGKFVGTPPLEMPKRLRET